MRKLLLLCALLISSIIYPARRDRKTAIANLESKEKRKLPKGVKPGKYQAALQQLIKQQQTKELKRQDRKDYSFVGGSLIDQIKIQ